MQASEDKWKATSKEFEKNWNFNHCLGAIDGKHIRNLKNLALIISTIRIILGLF